jgi:hypothetical protein
MSWQGDQATEEKEQERTTDYTDHTESGRAMDGEDADYPPRSGT